MTAEPGDDRLFHAVFKTSPVGIVVIGADGQILDANSRAETVLDLRYDELADRTYTDAVWNPVLEDGTPMAADELPVAKVFETGEPIFDFEHGIRNEHNEITWLSVNAAPITDDDGSVDRVILVVSEISDRQKYRQMLEKQNE